MRRLKWKEGGREREGLDGGGVRREREREGDEMDD